MTRSTRIAAIVLVLLATGVCVSLAGEGSADERDALARALQGAWLPLESGLAVSSPEGTPISAKYEIDDGAFQLSVYTMKTSTSAGDSFTEVIVDYNAGIVTRVEAIIDDDDLAEAQAQKAAMMRATRSLAEATAEAVKAHAGYRAVSAMPGLNGSRPVAAVTLVRGADWKVVTERLD
jgi:hypothetical protein